MYEYVWEACYNPCVYESAWSTISLHKTEEGAKKAVELHKHNLELAGDVIYDWQKWDVVQTKLME